MSARQLLQSIRLPLLAKDLTEQAAQKRTYVIRFVYALVLFASACVVFYSRLGVSAGAAQTLGRGRDQFNGLLTLQLCVLYFLVPLVTAGAITSEKQRDTLVLLLLTTLTPWQIVMQKFASRMMSILSFVCLSFPLLAITYAFGGVTVDDLVLGILLLIFSCLELGAFAIMCSAFLRTTAHAVIATYFGSIIFAWAIPGFCTVFSGILEPGKQSSLLAIVLVMTGFSIFLTFSCLSLAESVLVARASLPQRDFLLGVFRRLDGIYEQLNVVTGGIVLVRDRGTLPQRKPIEWRETRKKALGSFRYMFRILVALEVPILFAMQSIRLAGPGSAFQSGEDWMGGLLMAVWIASVSLVGIHAASVVSEERSRQTLDVLLTAPISARRMLAEKLAGVHRFLLMLLLPFFSIFVFEQWWHNHSSLDYLVLSTLTVVVYLPLVQWVALALGLRTRNQLSAIILTQSVLFGWTAALAFGGPLLEHFGITAPWLTSVLRALSPADMIGAIRRSVLPANDSYSSLSPWRTARLLTVAHFAFYAALYLVLRVQCERSADRFLGRMRQPAESAGWSLWRKREPAPVSLSLSRSAEGEPV